MPTQKRKVGAGDYDSDIEFLNDYDATIASAEVVDHKPIVSNKKTKAWLGGPPRLSSRMLPNHPSATESRNGSKAGSKTNEVMGGGNNGPNILHQRSSSIDADFKELYRKLDILLAWVGKLKTGVASQLGEPSVPTPPKPIRRAATFSGFHPS